jgi:hypothetical protein
MSSDHLTNQGIGHGRDWSVLPAGDSPEGPLEWTIDPEGSLVQGPLELESFRGRRLSLILEEGQFALLVVDRELKGVYLDGVHTLDIGTGEHQIPLSAQLIFLAANRTLDVVWNRGNPLGIEGRGGFQLIGGCNLVIDRPARFYHTFLDGTPGSDPGFVTRLVDQLVRGLMEEMLTGLETLPDPAAVQGHLTGLTPADLADGLESCGLACVNLALYTSAPPVEVSEAQEETREEPVGAGA